MSSHLDLLLVVFPPLSMPSSSHVQGPRTSSLQYSHGPYTQPLPPFPGECGEGDGAVIFNSWHHLGGSKLSAAPPSPKLRPKNSMTTCARPQTSPKQTLGMQRP